MPETNKEKIFLEGSELASISESGKPEDLVDMAYTVLDDNSSVLKLRESGQMHLIDSLSNKLKRVASATVKSLAGETEDDVIQKNRALVNEMLGLAEMLDEDMDEFESLQSSSPAANVNQIVNRTRDSWTGTAGRRVG